jgi:hypothetical protein
MLRPSKNVPDRSGYCDVSLHTDLPEISYIAFVLVNLPETALHSETIPFNYKTENK